MIFFETHDGKLHPIFSREDIIKARKEAGEPIYKRGCFDRNTGLAYHSHQEYLDTCGIDFDSESPQDKMYREIRLVSFLYIDEDDFQRIVSKM